MNELNLPEAQSTQARRVALFAVVVVVVVGRYTQLSIDAIRSNLRRRLQDLAAD